jgi:hypothetical protein
MTALVLALLLAGAASDDPLAKAHQRKDKGHVMIVTRTESTIENLSDSSVQVFGLRREYLCPSGELKAEAKCDPCVHPMSAWAERPRGIWVHEQVHADEDEDDRKRALSTTAHFQKYFELTLKDGGLKGGQSVTFFEYAGKLRAPPLPAAAARVRILVNGEPAVGATVPLGQKGIEIEARAERLGESGALESFPEADITFASSCAVVGASVRGKAGLALKPGVNRCEVTATAAPGAATATIVVSRAVSVEITYEGQPADEIVLVGADSNTVIVAYTCAVEGKDFDCSPDWKAEGGTLELLEEAARASFRLPKGASRGSVTLTDRHSGASDRISVRRKAP